MKNHNLNKDETLNVMGDNSWMHFESDLRKQSFFVAQIVLKLRESILVHIKTISIKLGPSCQNVKYFI